MNLKEKKKSHKVDHTLKKRRDINDHLRTLSKEDLEVDELETIGRKLIGLGSQVMPILLKKIEECQDDELVAKYAYLIEFMDDEEYVEPLTAILLGNRLSDFSKARLLATLRNFEVDISSPLFRPIFMSLCEKESYNVLHFSGDLKKDEEALINLLYEFDTFPADIRRKFIGDLEALKDPRTLSILRVLAEWYDLEVAVLAVKAIGAIPHPGAYQTLNKVQAEVSLEEIREATQKAQRHLRFMGVTPVEPSPEEQLGAVYRCYLSRIDGFGQRTVWISRREPQTQDKVVYFCLLLSDEIGVKDCYGSFSSPLGDFQDLVQGFEKEDALSPVTFDYAMNIIRDALFLNREADFPPPPLFILYRNLLGPESPAPTCYRIEKINPPAMLFLPEATPEEILSIPECREWCIYNDRTFDYAELFPPQAALVENEGRSEEWPLLWDFFSELVLPMRDVLARRLELTADFIRHTDKERLAAAWLLGQMAEEMRSAPASYLFNHPLVQLLIMESISQAQAALQEGYDLRQEEE